jgi:hypothetical protein
VITTTAAVPSRSVSAREPFGMLDRVGYPVPSALLAPGSAPGAPPSSDGRRTGRPGALCVPVV